jgi:hypothetical protein
MLLSIHSATWYQEDNIDGYPDHLEGPTIRRGVFKNADLTQSFLPDFWTLEKLSKIPIINGLRGITRGPKIGQRKVAYLDSLD